MLLVVATRKRGIGMVIPHCRPSRSSAVQQRPLNWMSTSSSNSSSGFPLPPVSKSAFPKKRTIKPSTTSSNLSKTSSHGAPPSGGARQRRHASIVLQPAPSLLSSDATAPSRISLDPPKDATPPPPAWMLRYFPEFFEPDPHARPDEHNQPTGTAGVYLYLATLVAASVLTVAYLYERFFSNEIQMARAAQLERQVQHQIQLLREEEQRKREHPEEFKETREVIDIQNTKS